MPLTNATLATHLPAGALTTNSSGDWVLNFSLLAPVPASRTSFDKPLGVLLEGVMKMVAAVNVLRAAANPALSAIALITKSIGSSNDPTTGEATIITEDYTTHFEYSDASLVGGNNDPAPEASY